MNNIMVDMFVTNSHGCKLKVYSIVPILSISVVIKKIVIANSEHIFKKGTKTAKILNNVGLQFAVTVNDASSETLSQETHS